MTLTAPPTQTNAPTLADIDETFSAINHAIGHLRARYPDNDYRWWAMNFLAETARFVKAVVINRDTSLWERVKQSLKDMNTFLHNVHPSP